MTPPKMLVLSVLIAATAFAAWLPPINLGEAINSYAADQDPQPGPGGTVLYFSSRRSGGYGGYDIYAAYYSNGHWLHAFNLGPAVNSPSNELGPTFVAGTTPELYFTSDRPGGKGGYDLFRSAFQSGAWQTSTDLTTVNASADDTDPFVTTSPRRVYFCSERPGGYGGADLYYSEYSLGAWSAPVNLGSGVNSAYYDRGPTIADNGTALYFCSDRPGGFGRYDIYFATRVGAGWGSVANLGAPINTANLEASPGVSPAGGQLYFDSDRSGGFGVNDIWGSNFTSAVAPASLGRVKASFR